MKLLLLLAACTGSVSDPSAAERAVVDGFEPAPATLQRLTRIEYQNSVRDLLPAGSFVPSDLEVDTILYGFATIGASEISIAPRAAEQYEAAAHAIAEDVFADPARRDALIGCPVASTSDPCIAEFAARFGRRVLRRPLDDDEVAELATLARTVGDSLRDPWQGVKYVVAALFQAPEFLFRAALGEPDPDRPGRRRYTSYEMASRLSYSIWQTTPDERLLDAAERGELVTTDGIEREARRLLEDERSQAALRKFFGEYFALDRLASLSKDPTLFPEIASGTLGASMRGELDHLFDEIAFDRDTDIREILSSRTTFVNAELASLYGLPFIGSDPAAFQRVTLPDESPRGGFLTSAGFLSLYAHQTITSPTLRGKLVRVHVLCDAVPPPPPGVVTELMISEETEPRTMRQRLEVHRTNPTCATCHAQMDPLGLAFEHFDALGRYRDTDGGLTIDPSGDVNGAPFAGARELGEILASDPDVGACFARSYYRYATGHVESPGERPAVDELEQRFAELGFKLRDLALALVLSDGFRYAGPPR
jgi:hypothetical protein